MPPSTPQSESKPSKVLEQLGHFDIAVIGAGPAGLSAAASAASHNLSHVLFEKAEVGNTVYDYQLRKHVMAEPNRLPLRSKIRFQAGTRESILADWNKAVEEHNVNIKRAEVTTVKKLETGFSIRTMESECTAGKVILAIGMQGSPRRLGVSGDNLPLVAYTLADPDAFTGKDIFIVGAGDAAIENAVALAEKNRVIIINRGAEFARAKDANVALILKAISTGKLKCLYESKITKVTETITSVATPEGDLPLPCDRIIARLGCTLPRKFLEDCGIEFPSPDATSLPRVNEHYESNVEGLYILGALIGYPLIKQAINQGFEVVQTIIGQPVPPADEVIIADKLKGLAGDVNSNMAAFRTNLPTFQDLTVPQFRELIGESTVHILKAGTVIFERNDYTESFFSIVEGSVAVELPNGGSVVIPQGNFFGEMGLVSGRRRSATVRAAESCVLLETPRKQMIKLLSSVLGVKKNIDQHFALRAVQTSLFPGSEAKDLEVLASKITQRICKKDEIIFREGEPGDALYVIRKGSVKIARKNASGASVVQTYLPAGSFFGEMAIVPSDDTPRSATVIAAVPCDLLVIAKADAEEFFAAFPAFRAAILQIADERRLQNMVRTQNEEIGEMLDFMFKEGLSDAENVLIINSDLCVSCDNCESACAATHNGYTRLDRKGGKSLAADKVSIQIPISCRHCENPLCMTDCPPDALTRKPNGEVVIRDSCIGCGNCVRNCPYGVIQLVYDKPEKSFSLWDWFKPVSTEKGPAKAAKCDLCEGLKGGPACVRACPTGAALRVNPSRILKILHEEVA